MSDTNYEIDKLRQELKALKKLVDGIDAPTKREFQALHTRVDKLEKMLESLRKAMSGMKGGPVEIGGAD